MIRVLYTIPNFITAGSQLEMVRLIQRLDKKKFEPLVLIGRAGGREDELLRPLGVQYVVRPYYFTAGSKARLFSQCIQTGLALRQLKCAIWHSYHYLDDYSEPLVAYAAGARAWIYTKKNMSWGSRGWRLRSALATRIIARNRRMMEEFFSDGALARKAVFIPAGIDVDEFAPAHPRPQAIRSRLGVPCEAIMVTCVAQLVPVKGHKILLEAVKGVADVHVVLAGDTTDAQYRAEVLAAGEAEQVRGRVHFVGYFKDVRALLQESDIFVLPTLNVGRGEAFGVALLEAMSCGLPCIATSTDGPRELLDDGRAGILVPPGDVSALGEAIRHLASDADARRRLGEAARRRATSSYSLDQETRLTEALYLEALGIRTDHAENAH